MEFELSDMQREICEVAETLLRDHSPPERLLGLEDSGMRVDRELWSAMREAGLTTVGISPDHGGADFSFAEACLVLEQAGKTTAAVPLLGHVVGLHALQEAGAFEELRQYVRSDRWLAVSARVDHGNTLRLEGGRLEGGISAVPYAPGAAACIVPARAAGNWKLCILESDHAGVTLERQTATDKSPAGKLVLRGVAARELGGTELLDWMRQRLIAGACAVQTGLIDEALRLTVPYVCEREAFGVKIGTFQAVGHRLADAYIDLMTLRLLSRNAASMLAGQGDALVDVLTARMAAGDAGHRVLHACQQVHGGIGHDRGYPLWRYAVGVKQNELSTMSSAEAVAVLGGIIAASPDRASL